MMKKKPHMKGALLLSAFMSIGLFAGMPFHAQATTANLGDHVGRETVLEYRLKAGFILNFIRFTSWNNGADSTREDWRLCTFVGDDFFRVLGQLNGKPVGQRRLTVMNGSQASAPEACNVIFVGAQDEDEISAGRLSRFGADVLVIGTGQEFVANGGHIAIVPTGGRYGFFLNVSSAEQAGLRFSSKLRALAVGEIATTGGQQ